MKTKYKIPFIEQHQKTECGLCCVAMLASYYKHEVTVRELRREIETGRDGSSFIQLIELLEGMKFNVKAYKIPNKTENVKFIKSKSIALWKSKHFIVIESINKKNILVVDPEIGRISYTYDEFMDGFSGYLISVRSTEQVEKRRVKIDYSFMKNILYSHKKHFLLLLFFTSLMYLVTFILPIAIKDIINTLQDKREIYNLKELVSIVLILAISYYLILILQNNSAIRLRASIDNHLNVSTISKLFKLPYKFYSNRSKGDIIYSLNGLPRIRELFANKVIMGFLDIGMLLCISGYLIYYDISIFLVSIILFTLNLFVLFISKQKLEQNNIMVSIQQNLVQNKQMETIYSMMGIKMEGFEDDIYKQWEDQFNKYIYRYIKSEKFSNYINSLLQTITFISPFIVLVATIVKFSEGKMTIGMVIAIYSFSGIFFSKTDSVFNTIVSIINSKVFISRINDILAEEDEKIGHVNHDLTGNITLSNVSFSYVKNGQEILKNINMEVEAGKKIAIVGTSGSGKSTISKLLVGLYQPSTGKIMYDGISENDINLQYIRKQIGIVPQDMTLFNKTIKENIVNGLQFTMEDVIEACKLTNIHDEIMNMPMKYNTLVSEMGMNLSGGQRQRIVLARALLKKPKVILLDEATSYLDNINEKKIMDEFKKNKITIIVIAHRLSTIIDSDCIYVFDEGEVREFGKHDQLMNRDSGIYKKMYESIKGEKNVIRN